ncbi:hypothetical protein CNYM01_13085 [Colletotrichum nymphaeae SA-01]|uniref:Uncharacterized protein n=1 Tax=Colletotrichum nymphaeae SA-01 TaxID=1460502 RepID=A0A135SMU4_9PEZI|nr:hypothetical protein CNYM01_13085 [Colletotrichum nymphaeae SA-01]
MWVYSDVTRKPTFGEYWKSTAYQTTGKKTICGLSRMRYVIDGRMAWIGPQRRTGRSPRGKGLDRVETWKQVGARGAWCLEQLLFQGNPSRGEVECWKCRAILIIKKWEKKAERQGMTSLTGWAERSIAAMAGASAVGRPQGERPIHSVPAEYLAYSFDYCAYDGYLAKKGTSSRTVQVPSVPTYVKVHPVSRIQYLSPVRSPPSGIWPPPLSQHDDRSLSLSTLLVAHAVWNAGQAHGINPTEERAV